MTTTTTIKGQEYTVEREERVYPLVAADLIARGFDGSVYYLTGKRANTSLAYRCPKSGKFYRIVGKRRVQISD